LSRKSWIFVAVPVFVLGTGLLVVCPNRAVAAARTIQDCEKIEAADAYNQCLASFGPAAHEHPLTSVAPRNEESMPHAARSQRGQRRHYGPAAAYAPHGRQRMEFTILPRR
jgi:hypothetical protein